MNTMNTEVIKAPDVSTADDMELLSTMKKNIEGYYEWFTENIDEGKEHKEFSFGDQWDEDVLTEYKSVGKVPLTFNKLNSYVRRLVGEIRAFTPALSVKRIHDEDEQNSEVAQILEDDLRAISLKSDAKSAYQTGFRDAITTGFGALRVSLEFENENSFKQKAIIEEVEFPERSFFDPAAKDMTKADGKFSGNYEVLSKKEFKEIYGFEPDFDGTANAVIQDSFAWIDEKNVSVANYYQKEFFKKKIVQLANGKVMEAKKYNELVDLLEENRENVDPSVFEQMEKVQSRQVDDFKIKHYKFIGNKILERKEWPIKLLPDVFIDGDSYYLNGRQRTQSFIKDAIDSQRLLNFINSEIAQNIKDANKEDYLGTPANIKGLEKNWKDKKRRKGILLANPDPKTGGMPQKQPPSQVNPQLHPLSLKTENDIRSSLGIFEANQGAGQNELSGVAEQTRITQGNLSTFVFVSNLNRSIEQIGRIVLALRRATLKGTQQISGISDDGNEVTHKVNQPLPFGGVQNDITQGEFEVSISASSAFTMQKMQEYKDILSYVGAFPQMGEVIPDIAARKLNSDESMEIASRAHELLPLQVKAMDKKDPQKAQQAQQQLAQQSQQQQMMQQMQIMLAKQKAQDDKLKAISDQMSGTADLMNAQTNRQKMQQGGVIEAAKLQAEERRTQEALTTEIIKTAREAESL